ncbi:MAG TPA: S9 family peptidase [Ktedonobacteraceae bacterium]|nr:S9 family peptidase [Ktedonobacteraceae bacterium]
MTTTPVARLIPRNILFGNPVKSSPQISPDGTKMAYLAPVDDVLNVWVGPVGSATCQPVTQDTDRGVRFYFWAADNTHIIYLQDSGGNENWRLYATNLETGTTRDLTPFENIQAQIVHHDKHFPGELLIGMNKENPQVHDVYHLDLNSGELSRTVQNPGNVARWLVDTHFQVRGAVAATPDGGQNLMVRADEQSAWQTILAWDLDDALASNPLGFTLDGQAIYLSDSRNANTARLTRLHLASGELSVLAEDAEYDLGSIMMHPDTHEVQAVSFNKDRVTWLVLDESIKPDFARIGELHRGDFSIVSRDDADQTWIIAFTVDDGPVSFYAYDRKQQHISFLFDNQPDLNTYPLARREPISFTARDGLPVHGYLTLPPGEQRTHLPMVLNVHGGPWGRDVWGYNPEAQWFANRGYACLQVNFRGSTGYGKVFLNAGDREWGHNMHHDLVDGVNWAIEQGIANPQKIAIYGGSYGGYAALVGATFTPDLFCCAIDVVGPSNLVTLLKTIPPYWSTFAATFYKRVGHPENEVEFLQSRSPLFKVDQIKIPLLIAQGANDPRVKQAESEQIVAALKSKGINHEYLLFPDEGHGFAKPENRIKFYAAAEKFLACHLGGSYEEA